ncbi:uncharacterized protein LOC143213706 isoform X3 [Lasioglossum baleicum]|uniref:uncharacterized protein LOC143213706 isoform X3 n=1 Tax=Lasioglossum baleicum TaxID=434251 RepID=UPI003FCEA659
MELHALFYGVATELRFGFETTSLRTRTSMAVYTWNESAGTRIEKLEKFSRRQKNSFSTSARHLTQVVWQPSSEFMSKAHGVEMVSDDVVSDKGVKSSWDVMRRAGIISVSYRHGGVASIYGEPTPCSHRSIALDAAHKSGHSEKNLDLRRSLSSPISSCKNKEQTIRHLLEPEFIRLERKFRRILN